MKTKRVLPVAPFRIDGVRGQGGWTDAANAMQPGGEQAYASPATSRFSNFIFEPGVPSRAKIVGMRILASVSAPRSGILYAPWYAGWADGLQWIDEAGNRVIEETVSSSGLPPASASFSAGELQEISGSFSPNLVQLFNEQRLMRERFSMMFYCLLSEWGSDRVGFDYVALEFDYELPAYPYKADLRI